jgi:hypothetical protein
MSKRTRKTFLAAITAGLLGVTMLTGGLASASSVSSGGTKGSPQPELKPFAIGPSVGGGSVAIEPDGGLLVAYEIKAGNGKTVICLIDRAGHKCSHSTTLSPLSSDSLDGSTYAFISSANHVEVIQQACCDSNASGGDLLWTSTNGGKSFGKAVRIGSLAVDTAALVGSDILFAPGDNGSGQLESVPIDATGPPASTATVTSGDAVNVGVTGYHGAALYAESNFTPTTKVMEAASGSNFDAASSYHAVASIGGQSLIAISGGALLTQQNSGSEALELRLFNGHGYGAAHQVPFTKGGGPEWFALDQDASGETHVFTETTHLPQDYNLYEQSTSGGKNWTSPVDLGNAIDDNSFAVGLDAQGSGLLLGTSPAIGYPVLAYQNVSFALSKSTVRDGRSVTGSGKVYVKAKGRGVALQVERSGRWYTIATTREKASGTFSFTIKGSAVGSHTYRAVASTLAGYVQYGYSAARTLRVTS